MINKLIYSIYNYFIFYSIFNEQYSYGIIKCNAPNSDIPHIYNSNIFVIN